MPAVRLAILGFAAAGLGLAQQAISAKAGLVYFVQGSVSIAGGERLGIGAVNRQLREGETLFSDAGRAEVLLNPGTVLRIGDRTRIRMDTVELTDTRLSIEAGSAVLTVQQAPKLDRVEIHIGSAAVAIEGVGVYRFDANGGGPTARVFNGQAAVSSEDGASKIVKRGEAVWLPRLELSKFDLNHADELQQWAEKRGTPPPAPMLPPMKCFVQPANTAELKDWLKDCLAPSGAK